MQETTTMKVHPGYPNVSNSENKKKVTILDNSSLDSSGKTKRNNIKKGDKNFKKESFRIENRHELTGSKIVQSLRIFLIYFIHFYSTLFFLATIYFFNKMNTFFIIFLLNIGKF